VNDIRDIIRQLEEQHSAIERALSALREVRRNAASDRSMDGANLNRLANRLTKILAETRKLNPDGWRAEIGRIRRLPRPSGSQSSLDRLSGIVLRAGQTT